MVKPQSIAFHCNIVAMTDVSYQWRAVAVIVAAKLRHLHTQSSSGVPLSRCLHAQVFHSQDTGICQSREEQRSQNGARKVLKLWIFCFFFLLKHFRPHSDFTLPTVSLSDPKTHMHFRFQSR